MSLIYQDKVPSSYRDGFIKKINNIANELGIDPNWLMAIISFESSKSFSPSKTNGIGCVGFIQFCPDLGKNYKTINGKKYYISDLAKMDWSEQLDVVHEYYSNYANKINNYIDTYFVTFFPLAIGKPDDWIIEGGGLTAKQVYDANPAFRQVKDGKLRVWEVKKVMLSHLPKEWLKNGSFSLAIKSYGKELLLGGIFLALGGYLLYKYSKK
jgi:hypothetical protein